MINQEDFSMRKKPEYKNNRKKELAGKRRFAKDKKLTTLKIRAVLELMRISSKKV